MNIRAPSVAFAVTLAALPIGRESDAPDGLFTDATATSGLTFTHFNGMSGELYYPEVMPPGVALLDYNRRRSRRVRRPGTDPRIETRSIARGRRRAVALGSAATSSGTISTGPHMARK